ncbi:predicted protein [Histoplasma capsulatum G186AR]|uniref:Uncharacterized protein n=1 Tax=Ajellomyces capsulatus (strain G186AR / H82 / ATCC MYA-2454 / RMSCC 2432) TaxID=447093 RepID=C0P1D2_AJECG|nr:uncharacterized protein HCBG_09212 [Histoplasma capsulatum G186AR]EEH02552.1 predicted protein [Histoplasma capsulatum G186AR]
MDHDRSKQDGTTGGLYDSSAKSLVPGPWLEFGGSDMCKWAAFHNSDLGMMLKDKCKDYSSSKIVRALDKIISMPGEELKNFDIDCFQCPMAKLQSKIGTVDIQKSGHSVTVMPLVAQLESGALKLSAAFGYTAPIVMTSRSKRVFPDGVRLSPIPDGN